jgi:lambda repressor-like predicted transcriptional regulator
MVTFGQKFDEDLFSRKLSKPSRELQERSLTLLRNGPRTERELGTHIRWLRFVDGNLELIREWIKLTDQLCREVWRTQGGEITPGFVRDILIPKALITIESRDGVIQHCIDRSVARTSKENPYAARHKLAMEIARLKAEMGNRYEIEARELEYGLARNDDITPEVEKKPTQSSRLASVTRAPAPVTPLGGGWIPSRPQPSEIPPNPPTGFPKDLWPQTNVILLRAQRKFPIQTQTLELCKHIVAEMTSLFCEAVAAGKMQADAVQREYGGGMEDLLHFLLVHNDPGPPSGWGLSDQAYRLGKEVRKSDEWLRLGEAIAEAQQNNVKLAKCSRDQNDAQPLQSAEHKFLKPGASNTREEFLKAILKKKGFSIRGWACKAKVDFHTADNYLKGKTKPNPDTLKALADALDVKVEELPV